MNSSQRNSKMDSVLEHNQTAFHPQVLHERALSEDPGVNPKHSWVHHPPKLTNIVLNNVSMTGDKN